MIERQAAILPPQVFLAGIADSAVALSSGKNAADFLFFCPEP
jgi:hypothetical protein